MKARAIAASIAAGLLIAAAVAAHPADKAHAPAASGKAVPRSQPATMNGEFIDPQCYFTHDSRGAAHASCAAICAKGGQGLAFLDDATGVVYPLIAKAHGLSQNEGLLPHLGKLVQVKGLVYRKPGGAVLLVQSVTAQAAKAK